MDPQYQNVRSKLLGSQDATQVVGMIQRDDFDKDFVFGTAGASYQFEGAAGEYGKGPNIWDSWTHNQPDRIRDGSNGDVAVDQYHLYKEDTKLMKQTGFEACRFSISWARILPGGRLNGGVNKEGIKYYNDLIDTLLAQGLEPYVTIFHFDLPLSLELEYGGFLSDKVVKDYCEYAELCFWEFGDRVKNWITFNEGWTYCTSGYMNGTFPPGHGSTSQQNSRYHPCEHKGTGIPPEHCTSGDPGREPYLAAHNMLLAHAYAVDLYRKHFQEAQGGKIGVTNVSHFFEPLNDTDEDRDASIRALDWMLGWFVAPIATGDYPPNMRRVVGDRLPIFSPEETELIKGSYDFLGLNYYTTFYVVNTPRQPGDEVTYLSDQELNTQTTRDGVSIGEQSGTWTINVPRGIYNLLVYTKETYNINLIYITENGLGEPNETGHSLSEARLDPMRIKYHSDHLWYLKRAIREGGVNVKVYFLWSFSDNFEWADGYSTRFGIFYIDYLNGVLTRYPKSSAIWWMNFMNKKSIKGSKKQKDAKRNGYKIKKNTLFSLKFLF